MKNYNKMSDFEINKRVLKFKLENGFKLLSYVRGADKRSAGVVSPNDQYYWFDFCNSWADAGPVIHSKGISIVKSSNEDGKWFAITPFLGEKLKRLSALDINPLRAAMIVFLLMMDAEENYELA